MAGARIPIASLPEATTVPAGGLLVVQDGATTKKMAIDLVGGGGDVSDHVNDPLDAHDASAVSATANGALTGLNVQAQLGQVASALATDANNLANHINDTSDAHDASAISATAASGLSGADVQAQLASANTGINSNSVALSAHIGDTDGAHAATAISATPNGALTGSTVQAQLGQAATHIGTTEVGLAAHIADSVDAHAASAISFSPSGTISATTVQAAILEVAAESGGSGGGGGTIVSVNGDAGPSVTLDASEIPFTPTGTVAASNTQAAVAEVASDAASALTAHENDTTNIHGIANTANLVLTNDSRLTNTRTPTAHAASHQDGGIDELALDGSQITSGTIPEARIDPTIARDSDVTTAIDAHINDTTAAHMATAVGFTPVGTIAANTVQTAVAEVATDAATALNNHLTAIAGGAHNAGAIAFTPTGSISSTTVQAAIAEVAAEAGGGGGGGIASVNGDTGPAVDLIASEIPMNPTSLLAGPSTQQALAQIDGHIGTLTAGNSNNAGAIANHIADTNDAHAASAISFIPVGSIAASTVQDAIAEVATEYASWDLTKASTATAINTTAPLTGGGDLSATRTLGISDFTTTTRGAVPNPTAASGRFLSDSGAWALPPASASGTGNVFPFTYSTTTTAPPANAQIRGNNATFASSTALYIHETTTDGLDVAVGLGRIKAGFQIYVQDYASSAKYAVFNVTADAVDSGAYWTVTVTPASSLGTITAGKVAVQSLSAAQASKLFSTTSTAPGLAPGSNGATTNFLRGDGTWAAPAADTTKVTGLNGATGLWIGTQAQYDAIGSKVSTVVYVVTA